MTGAGVCLYLLARRALLRREGENRNLELITCLLVVLVILGGFALAHVGINQDWTGQAVVSNFDWSWFASAFALAILVAHLLLRLQRSRVDQLLLPVAGFLVGIGLITLYVWETRDANAYISTRALPALRAYERAVADNDALVPSERQAMLAALGSVPNELDYDARKANRLANRFSTVLNPDWLETYNASVRRVERARSAHLGLAAAPHVREVELYAALRRQLFAAALGLLLVPALVFTVSRLRAGSLLRQTRLPLALAILLVAAAGAALVASTGRSIPALLPLGGGQSITVFEPLKVGLVVLLALLLGRARRSKTRRIAAAPAGLALTALAALLFLDHGAGVALLAVAVFMLALVVRERWGLVIAGVGLCVVVAVPLAGPSLWERFPTTVRVRLEMWSDPWRAYERAELRNQVARSAARIASYRGGPSAGGEGPDRARPLAAEHVGGSPIPSSRVAQDVSRVEQELRWRLEGLGAGAERKEPFVPAADRAEELLLLEAENLWAELGGFSPAVGTESGRHAFAARVDDALARLQEEAERLGRQSHTASVGSSGGSGVIDHLAPAPDNFQLQRSLYALRAGGALGVGLGRGRPEAIPGVVEDAVVASLGEALGLAGVILVALFLLLIATRGIEAGERAGRSPSGLLIVGLGALFGLQALISLGGITGALPFTGLTFPFLSRGGTSLLANFAALALLMAFAPRPLRPRVLETCSGPRLSGGAQSLLRAGGFVPAFALLAAAVAPLQLGGRTVTSGLLASLPDARSPFLHAADQWRAAGYRVAPGTIVDREGRVLARTLSLGGHRVYPDPALGSSMGHTLLQLDLTFHDDLLRPSRPRARGARVGPTLVTTIDSRIQQAVHEAIDEGALEAGLPSIAELRGAIVVLDVRDGGILALESRPTFSLAELTDPLAWAKAEARDRRHGFPYRYLNRAIKGYYPPGSIFKTITAAAVLERGLHTLHSHDFDYRRGSKGPRPPNGLDQFAPWHQLALPDGPPITDGNHPHLEKWLFGLEEAFAWSCNIAFAELGLELGASDLIAFARRFGFERPIEVPGLGSATSTLDNDVGQSFRKRYVARSASNLARTAFGQGQARVTPLQMALVPAAIANEGTIMQPHVILGWRSRRGTWLEQTPPRVFARTGFRRTTLEELRKMMRSSATYGWARTASLNADNANPGVAGKTGSAEWSDEVDISHAWFIGYFPTESPRLALAIVIERGGAGPILAARIARRIFASEAAQRYIREE